MNLKAVIANWETILIYLICLIGCSKLQTIFTCSNPNAKSELEMSLRKYCKNDLPFYNLLHLREVKVHTLISTPKKRCQFCVTIHHQG